MYRIVIVFVLAVVLSLVSWVALDRTYVYDAFASDEARQSLEVTEAQTAELLASRRLSDVLAYGAFGAALALICGAACNPTATKQSAAIAAGIGVVLGASAGALGAYLAHVHDANVRFPPDPMLYWFVRWAAILFPIGLACGVTAQFAGKPKVGADGIVGGLIGAAVAVLIYCLASGSATRLESHSNIFPGNSENRLLAFASASICIALGVTLQLKRQAKHANQQASQEEEIVNAPDAPASKS